MGNKERYGTRSFHTTQTKLVMRQTPNLNDHFDSNYPELIEHIRSHRIIAEALRVVKPGG